MKKICEADMWEKKQDRVPKEQYAMVLHQQLSVDITEISDFCKVFSMKDTDSIAEFSREILSTLFQCRNVVFEILKNPEDIYDYYLNNGMLRYEKIYSNDALHIPVKVSHEIAAIVRCEGANPYYFSISQLGVILMVSHQLSLALSIVTARRQYLAMEESLNNTIYWPEMVSNLSDAEHICFSDLANEVVHLVPAQTAIVFLADDSQNLKPFSIAGENIEHYQDLFLTADGNLISSSLKEGKPVVYGKDILKGKPVSSILAYPISGRRGMTAVIALFNKRDVDFSDVDVKIVGFAAGIAVKKLEHISTFYEPVRSSVFTHIIEAIALVLRSEKQRAEISAERALVLMKLYWGLSDIMTVHVSSFDGAAHFSGENTEELTAAFLPDRLLSGQSEQYGSDFFDFKHLSSESKKRIRRIKYVHLENARDICGAVFYKNRGNDPLASHDVSMLKDISLMLIRVMSGLEISEHLKRLDRLAVLGEMSAGVAHEIRNPLGGIELFATYLRNDFEKGSKNYGIICDIIDAVRNLNKIVSDLLTYARPARAEKIEAALSEIADGALLFIEPAVQKHGIEIRRDYRKEKNMVNIDPNQIRQAIINMLLNAVDAMENGGILDIIIDESEDNVILTIADTGSGIENESRLFRPFFTTKEKGTGLGLVISQRYVEENEGMLILRNRKSVKGAEAVLSFKKNSQIPI